VLTCVLDVVVLIHGTVAVDPDVGLFPLLFTLVTGLLHQLIDLALPGDPRLEASSSGSFGIRCTSHSIRYVLPLRIAVWPEFILS
jgi:hypothetical protein